MWYLKSAVETYQNLQQSVESGLSDVRAAALTPLNLVKNFFAPSPDTEVESLRRRVAELEQRLAEAEAEARPKSRKRSSGA